MYPSKLSLMLVVVVAIILSCEADAGYRWWKKPKPQPQPYSVMLAWDANPPEDNVTGYKTYHGTQSRVYSYEHDVGLNTTAVVSGLQPGIPYYFAVTAYNGVGESDYSEEVSYERRTP